MPLNINGLSLPPDVTSLDIGDYNIVAKLFSSALLPYMRPYVI